MDNLDNIDIADLAARLETAENLIDALQQRCAAFERRLEHTENRGLNFGYDYRISQIHILKPSDTEMKGRVDENFYVDSVAEAEAKQKEIFARREGLRRKVLILTETSFKPVPF